MTTPMRVAVLMASGSLGGAERSLLALATRLRGTSPFTLLLPGRGDLEDAAADAGVDARVVPWPARLLSLGERSRTPALTRLAAVVPSLRAAVDAVRREILALGPDVLVTNGVKPHIVGALVARSVGDLPLVWYVRDSVEGRGVACAALRTLSSRCDAAIAISRYVASDASRYLRAAPLDVIYNIVDIASRDEGRAVPLPPRRAGEIRFAAVGALTPLKGHEVFIRAAAAVRRRCPEASFLVVGGNRYVPEQQSAYEADVRRLAASLPLHGALSFLGHRRDVATLLREVDVLVQPNVGPEAFGRSVVEAMVSGVPVIASRGWSFLELIEDGQTGWLVPPGDPQALAERMVDVALDGRRRREVAVRAGAFIAQAIQPEACVAAFDATLRRAVAARRMRRAA